MSGNPDARFSGLSGHFDGSSGRAARLAGAARALPAAVPWPLGALLGVRTTLALFGVSPSPRFSPFTLLAPAASSGPAAARYSLIAREMLESGDWIQPRLNHVRYDEKPPLLYWAIAACYHWLGPSEFSSRLPSAASYVGAAALTFGVAYELVGEDAAPLAALVYATSIGTFLFGRFVFTDSLLVFGTTLALYAFCRVVTHAGTAFRFALLPRFRPRRDDEGVRGRGAARRGGLHLRDSLRGWIVRKALRPVLGAIATASVFLPWHVAMALRDRSFIDFYVVNEHLRRFLNTREPIDYVSQSVVGFWVATLFWLLPWALFLPGALVSAIRYDKRRLGIPLLWAAWVIGFFALTGAGLEYRAFCLPRTVRSPRCLLSAAVSIEGGRLADAVAGARAAGCLALRRPETISLSERRHGFPHRDDHQRRRLLPGVLRSPPRAIFRLRPRGVRSRQAVHAPPRRDRR